MQLGSSTSQIPDGLLAAITLLRKKPHQGVPSRNLAPHQGIDERNSTAALGLRASEHLNRVWSRSTGKERDTESGNDYFGARYYNSATGRFLSPDWSAKAEPVPYAKLDDPQSLNLYSYVRNNPMSRTDPTGHCDSSKWLCKTWTSATTSLAVGVSRISPSAARKLYETANPDVKVPFDTVRQRYFDMAHIKPLADGGTNAVENLKPQEHGEHMAEHMANGDFKRWASQAKDTVVKDTEAAGKEVEAVAKDVNSSEAVTDIKDAASEVVHNPGEAVKDGAAAVTEAVETGEVPPI
jgi:RHS repeat-associated protein